MSRKATLADTPGRFRRAAPKTETHALFLEWHCLQATRKAARYADENGNSGTKPHTPAPMEADCLEIFDTGRTLLATLGYPLFDAVTKPTAATDVEEMFYCKGTGADGRGLYTAEGFVVLKGSSGRKESVNSFVGSSGHKRRLELVQSGIMQEQGDRVVFAKDQLFRSPTMAAQALLGRNTNGWVEWKTKSGETLDALKRQGAD